MIFLYILLLVVGFILLTKGADKFVDACSKLAKAVGIPSLIVGLTIVAFGTSAPECAVSVIASIKGNSDIAIGNVVGSNICNLLLVLGTASFFGDLYCKKKIITRDFVYSLLSYVVIIVMSIGAFNFQNGTGFISRSNGILLLLFLLIYVYSLVIEAKDSIKSKKKEEKEKITVWDVIWIFVGLVAIVGGGELVVTSATNIAKVIGISDKVIALTVVAIGTSLPELVTSVVAVRKGEHDIAIGNVIGSNIFNIFMILGLSGLANPLHLDINTLIDMFVMFASGLTVFLLTLHNMKIGRKRGIFMLLIYITYTVYLFIR